jgi:MFS family permease
MMDRDRLHFLLLNIGHYLDHLFTLIFATVAALALSREWQLGYGDLLRYATPGFFAFGVFALPAGWLADKWSRDGMMGIFFVGIGLASIATSLARTPLQVGIGLFAIGMFAAIYHPVGLAIVTSKWQNTGSRIAVNGVWGNMGVACAALLTGYLIDHGGWRAAFIMPGFFSVLVGLVYVRSRWAEITRTRPPAAAGTAASRAGLSARGKAALVRFSAIVFITAAVSSIIFQSTTFALPKILDERVQGLLASMAAGLDAAAIADGTDKATIVGAMAFGVFALASLAQLVVGRLLDQYGARPVFMALAAIQFVFFAIMPGLTDGPALTVALGFMLGAFGQIPINDFMIGKMATGEFRARVYGIRYVVSFTVLAATLPLIGFVHAHWGFDTLFRILAVSALVILAAVSLLPPGSPAQVPTRA